jgi:hypothetical protein
VRKADNLPPFCGVVTNSGDLKFLEPSGAVQACNGNDLPCTRTVENKFISPSSTVGIQPHVSSLYVGHLQVVIQLTEQLYKMCGALALRIVTHLTCVHKQLMIIHL